MTFNDSLTISGHVSKSSVWDTHVNICMKVVFRFQLSKTIPDYKMYYNLLETFMGVVQRTGAGSKPRISRVVSKSDRDHGSGYYGNRTLGLMPAGTICHSTRTLGLYPILINMFLATKAVSVVKQISIGYRLSYEK